MNAALGIALSTLLAGSFWLLRQRPIAMALLLVVATFPLAFGAPAVALLTTTLVLSILAAQPLYVVLGVVTVVCFQYLAEAPPIDYGIFPEKIFELTDKNVLLAIPFFIISGAIMTHGGIARRLIDFAKALTRSLPGGLALAAIGACVLFAAISGSSPVTVIAIGSMMYPALKEAGFGERRSIGLLSSAGSLGIIIPPSIPMILYAIVVSGRQVVDVGELFLAGIGPGLVLGGLLGSFVVGTTVMASDVPKRELARVAVWLGVVLTPLVIGELLVPIVGAWGHFLGPIALAVLAIWFGWQSFLAGFWALMLPVLILGGIYSGIFSPTQAAAVAVVYAFVVELFIHQEMTWNALPKVVVDSTAMMGSLIVIMVIAFVFNDFLVEAKVPERAVAWLESLDLSKITFLLAVNILLLAVGCFMDILSAILIVAPLIVPMAMAFSIDPVHMGIIFIVNLELGYLTPPLGLNLFVSSTLFKKGLGEVIRAVVPYTLMMLAGIIIITYVPAVALGPGQWIQELRDAGAPTPEATEQPKQPEHPEPSPGEGGGKVLSIEELMNQANEKGATQASGQGQTGSAKEQQAEPQPDADQASEATAAGGSNASKDANQNGQASPNKGEVLSIEELMRQAEQRQAEQRQQAREPDTDAQEKGPNAADKKR